MKQWNWNTLFFADWWAMHVYLLCSEGGVYDKSLQIIFLQFLFNKSIKGVPSINNMHMKWEKTTCIWSERKQHAYEVREKVLIKYSFWSSPLFENPLHVELLCNYTMCVSIYILFACQCKGQRWNFKSNCQLGSDFQTEDIYLRLIRILFCKINSQINEGRPKVVQ